MCHLGWPLLRFPPEIRPVVLGQPPAFPGPFPAPAPGRRPPPLEGPLPVPERWPPRCAPVSLPPRLLIVFSQSPTLIGLSHIVGKKVGQDVKTLINITCRLEPFTMGYLSTSMTRRMPQSVFSKSCKALT